MLLDIRYRSRLTPGADHAGLAILGFLGLDRAPT